MAEIFITRGGSAYASLNVESDKDKKNLDPRLVAVWNGKKSGVTFGRGFDIGQKFDGEDPKKECYDVLVNAGVSPATAKELAQYTGVRGKAAEEPSEKLRAAGVQIPMDSVFNLMEYTWTKQTEDVLNDITNSKSLQPILRDCLNPLRSASTNLAIMLNPIKEMQQIQPTMSLAEQAKLLKSAILQVLKKTKDEDWKGRCANLLVYIDRIQKTAEAGVKIVFVNEPISLENVGRAANDPNNKTTCWAQFVEEKSNRLEKEPHLLDDPTYMNYDPKVYENPKAPDKIRRNLRAVFEQAKEAKMIEEFIALNPSLNEEQIKVILKAYQLSKQWLTNFRDFNLVEQAQDLPFVKETFESTKRILEFFQNKKK